MLLEFTIIEHYKNNAPEPFGFMLFESIPKIGAKVQLKWLDGSDAHKVRITAVSEVNLEIHVQKE